jgi:hypothetical protein
MATMKRSMRKLLPGLVLAAAVGLAACERDGREAVAGDFGLAEVNGEAPDRFSLADPPCETRFPGGALTLGPDSIYRLVLEERIDCPGLMDRPVENSYTDEGYFTATRDAIEFRRADSPHDLRLGDAVREPDGSVTVESRAWDPAIRLRFTDGG